jgi:hypothetical protein
MGARDPGHASQEPGIHQIGGRDVSAVQKVIFPNDIGIDGSDRARKNFTPVDDLLLVAEGETLWTDPASPSLDRARRDMLSCLFRGYFRRPTPPVDVAGTAASVKSSRAFRA